MTDSARTWGAMEIATAVTVAMAGVFGAVWGLANGLNGSQSRSLFSRLAVAAIQGGVGAVLAAFVALIAVALVTVVFGVVSAVLRRVRR